MGQANSCLVRVLGEGDLGGRCHAWWFPSLAMEPPDYLAAVVHAGWVRRAAERPDVHHPAGRGPGEWAVVGSADDLASVADKEGPTGDVVESAEVDHTAGRCPEERVRRPVTGNGLADHSPLVLTANAWLVLPPRLPRSIGSTLGAALTVGGDAARAAAVARSNTTAPETPLIEHLSDLRLTARSATPRVTATTPRAAVVVRANTHRVAATRGQRGLRFQSSQTL